MPSEQASRTDSRKSAFSNKEKLCNLFIVIFLPLLNDVLYKNEIQLSINRSFIQQLFDSEEHVL